MRCLDFDVSVIIPNYNTAHFLSEAIKSVLASVNVSFEIIVVDDGSTDNSTEVVKPYLEFHNFKFIAQANKGLAGARNTGIKAAAGEYLVFLDSDDIILPDKLENQARFLHEHLNYEAIYSTSIFFKDGESDSKIPTEFPNYSGHILQQLLYGNFIHVNAIMVRKASVVKVGMFDESLRELEDWDLWLRLSMEGASFYFQDKIFSEVRLRKGSMTSDQLKMNKTMVQVLEKHLPALIKSYPGNRELLKDAFYALLQYMLLAKQTNSYNARLLDAIDKVGVSFIPIALKLYIKRHLSKLISFENLTTKRLEEVWNA